MDILNGDYPAPAGYVHDPPNQHWLAYVRGDIDEVELRKRLWGECDTAIRCTSRPCWHCGSAEEIHPVDVAHVTPDGELDCDPYRVMRCGMCGALGAPGYDIHGGQSARDAWNERA